MPTKTLAKPKDYRSSGNEAPQCALDGTPLPNVVEYIKEGKVDLVINIPEVRYIYSRRRAGGNCCLGGFSCPSGIRRIVMNGRDGKGYMNGRDGEGSMNSRDGEGSMKGRDGKGCINGRDDKGYTKYERKGR